MTKPHITDLSQEIKIYG